MQCWAQVKQSASALWFTFKRQGARLFKSNSRLQLEKLKKQNHLFYTQKREHLHGRCRQITSSYFCSFYCWIFNIISAASVAFSNSYISHNFCILDPVKILINKWLKIWFLVMLMLPMMTLFSIWCAATEISSLLHNVVFSVVGIQLKFSFLAGIEAGVLLLEQN